MYWGRVLPVVMPVALVEVPSPSVPKVALRFDVAPSPAPYPIILGILRIPLSKPPSNVGFLAAGGLRSLLCPAFCNPMLSIRCWSSSVEGLTV